MKEEGVEKGKCSFYPTRELTQKIAKGRGDILPRDKHPEKYGKQMKVGREGGTVSLNQIFTTLCSAAPFVGSEMVRLTDSERKGYLY